MPIVEGKGSHCSRRHLQIDVVLVERNEHARYSAPITVLHRDSSPTKNRRDLARVIVT